MSTSVARRTMSMIRMGNGAMGAGEAEITALFEDVSRFMARELQITHAYLDRTDERQNFIEVIIGQGIQVTDDMISKIKNRYNGSTIETTPKGVQVNVPLLIHQRRAARSSSPGIRLSFTPSPKFEIIELVMMICSVVWLLYVIMKELIY